MPIFKRIALAALVLCLGVGLVTPADSHAITLPGLGNTANGTEPGGHAVREQRLTQTLAALGDMRKALNRAEFDAEALLESLDYDPEAIIEFVRDEIRFEPYEGLLRGAQGVLIGRAGNALDQSLLLASLLLEAGVDARLAYGKLDEGQAMQLVQSLRGQPTPASPHNLPDLRTYLKKMAQSATADAALSDAVMKSIDGAREPQELSIWATAEAGRDYLQTHLGKAGISLDPVDAEPQLARQSLNYFWVEYKDGAADRWQRLHAIPAGDMFNEETVPVLEYLTDAIPEHFQHRLRLTVKLERQVSGKTEVVDLIQPWERPVANMVGKRLSFANQPNGMHSLQDLDDLVMVEARTTFLVPTLNDVPAPGAQAFDLRGRTISLSTLQMDGAGAAAIFQTVSNKTLDAADALAGLSAGKPDVEASPTAYSLRRVWLEYTSIYPDGTERIDERTIWQAPAGMSETTPAVLWELATPHGIGVATSEYPASYLLDVELARLQSLEPLLRWVLMAQGASTEQSLPPMPAMDAGWLEFPELSYLSQFDAGIDPDASQSLVYRAEPSIVVTRHGLRNIADGVTGFADVDIVHNRRTVLRTDTVFLQTDPQQALRLGAWETLVEQVELERRLPALFVSRPDAFTIISANRMYHQPQRSQQTPQILQNSKDLDGLPVDSLDGSARLAIEQDLQRGYVVLAEKSADPQPAVWWRVDPATGEALGRGLDGRGQSLAEATHIMTLVGMKTSLVVGTTLCAAAKNTCSFADCVASAAITTAIGGGFGFVLGRAFGAAAGSIIAQVVDRGSHGYNPLPLCYNYADL